MSILSATEVGWKRRVTRLGSGDVLQTPFPASERSFEVPRIGILGLRINLVT